LLERQCAAAKGCHGDDPTESIKLDLRRGHAFGDLVNVVAKARPEAWRVRPGEPSKSFLIDKLEGRTLRPGEGKRMPLDADTGVPIEPDPLPAGFIDATLRPWIEAGAPDN